MNSRDLIGSVLTCEGEGARRPCIRCGSTKFIVEPGKGPHVLGLRCDGCGKDFRWLSQTAIDNISLKEVETASLFERLSPDPDPVKVSTLLSSDEVPW